MCDLIVAGDNARLGQRRSPASSRVGRDPRWREPRANMSRWSYAHRRPGDGPASYELGIVNKGSGRDDRRGRQAHRDSCRKPPLALGWQRAVLRRSSRAFRGPGRERKSFYFLFSTEDQKEGMHAFLEAKGVFKGR